MERTFALVFWIASLITAITPHSDAGAPLSLRCSSRPTLSTVSSSSDSPFLSADPHLSLIPNFFLPTPVSDCEDYPDDETSESSETELKTIIILHKMKKADDKDIEIIIRNKTKDDQSMSNENDQDEQSDNENEIADEFLMNRDEAMIPSNKDIVAEEVLANVDESSVPDDEINQ